MNPLWKKILNKIKTYLNEEEVNFVKQAYDYAKNIHEGSLRKSKEPYFNHPIRVTFLLSEIHADSTTLAAGLLHGVVKETKITSSDLGKMFGSEVEFLIHGITKISQVEYSGNLNQAENFRNLFLAMAQDLRVVMIKLADQVDNLKTIWALEKEKQKPNALETLEIFAPLAYRLGLTKLGSILEDLAFPYAYPEDYRYVAQLSGRRQKELEIYLKNMSPVIEKVLKENDIKPVKIESRAKHLFSIWRKLKKEDMDITKIYDLVATRILVSNLEECYSALGIIHQLWKPVPGRFKDYIANPKPNGYQSLHTTVFGPNGRIMEIQIRDERMHQEAEWGIASHWYYNIKKGSKGYNQKKDKSQFILDKKFLWLKQLKDWQKDIKDPQEFLELLKNDFLKDRIYVLTPQGDIIDLPEGATPVDFAYQIHSDIGNQCVGSKINGKLVPLDFNLKSGDVIEILIQKNKKPSYSWLEFVKMKETKTQIRKNIKQPGL